MNLDAVDGNVLDAGDRVACNDQPGRDVRTIVMFTVGWNRQQFAGVAITVNHLLARGVGMLNLPAGKRIGSRFLKTREQA